MVIKASASAEVRLLVEALSSADDVQREAAAARLAVIGPRAVARLLAAYDRAPTDDARLTILRVIEPMKDPRAMGPARQALPGGGALGLAAAQVIRALLDAPASAVRAEALDALVSVALDPLAPRETRLAAFDTLDGLPVDVRAGVGDLRNPAADVTPDRPASAGESALSEWRDALQGRLPASPASLREAIRRQAGTAPLTSLQKLVEALRARERDDPDQAAAWTALRGTVHHALALRGSRVALYDLREALSQTRMPLPVSFLSAVHAVGDRSCLEPLARAFAQAAAPEDWWRGQLAAAFRVVMTREKLTRRSAVIKKVVVRWPEIAGRVVADPGQ
jgi:hypothetical protein